MMLKLFLMPSFLNGNDSTILLLKKGEPTVHFLLDWLPPSLSYCTIYFISYSKLGVGKKVCGVYQKKSLRAREHQSKSILFAWNTKSYHQKFNF